MKRLEYEFYFNSGFPYIKSNLVFDELDLLELLSSDIPNKKLVKDCINHIKLKKVWWSNASKLEYKGSFVVIKPAFEWNVEAKVHKSELIRVLDKFMIFIDS